MRGNASRRDADVLPCAVFRRYTSYSNAYQNTFVEGICFFLPDGSRIVNYPKQHAANCTSKHQGTRNWFKPTVRVFKNIRNRMISDGKIKDGLAPSYYLEGLLYNVPNSKFGTSYSSTVAESINWILQADKSKFVCANEQYYLVRAGEHVCWEPADCEAFLSALVDYWNSW